MRKYLKLITSLASVWSFALARAISNARKRTKLIVSLVLVSSVALAGAISVEVGGFQYLNGLVLTAPSGTALTLSGGNAVMGTGTVSSTAASGNYAFAVNTNGARVDFGAGASDYASSDGTTVLFTGPVESASYIVGVGFYGTLLSLIGANPDIAATAAGHPIRISDAEGLRFMGVTTANLVAPDGGFAGTLQYDTTTNRLTGVHNNTRITYATTAEAPATGACTNQFVRGVNGASAPTCATVSLTADVTGTLAQGNGGTGATALTCTGTQKLTSNGTVYSCAADTDTVPYTGTCTNQFVRDLNGASAPTCETVNLAGDVTGTLPIARGGTGTTTVPIDGGIVYGASLGYASTGQGTTGQCLQSAGANAPTWGACSAADTWHGAWSGTCFGECPEINETTNFFPGPFRSNAGKSGSFGNITCSWGTAGNGGTTGVVVAIVNASGTVLCSGALGACSTAAGVAMTRSCATAFLADTAYSLALTAATDCAGSPANPANIVCNVEITE